MDATKDQHQQSKPTKKSHKKPVAEEASDKEVVIEETTDIVFEAPKERHNKTGIIVGIVLGLLTVALVVTAYVWACIYHNPNKVLADATNKFFNAENVALDGIITLKTNQENSPVKEVLLSFDSASTNLPNASNIHISANIEGDDSKQIKLDSGAVIMKDGVFYIKLSGMIDALKNLGIKESELGWIYEVVELVDNEWWRVDIAEITSALEVSKKDQEQINDFHGCLISAAEHNTLKEIGELYQNNDFLELQKVDEARFSDGSTFGKSFEGTDYYSPIVSYTKMAGFINGMADIDTMRRIYGCVRDFDQNSDFNADSFNEVSAKELEQAFENESDVDVFFEISKWGHELKHIVAKVSDDGGSSIINLTFTYKQATVSAPEDYRPATELIDEVTEIISEVLNRGYEMEDFEIYNNQLGGGTLI